MFTPLPNDTILQNRYQIINLLGKGGMGAVYHAKHLRLKTEAAIKQIILADDGDYIACFEHEASLLANLRHKSLPEVKDFFEEDSSYFIVMELIKGEDLYERLKRLQKEGVGYLPIAEVHILTIQLLGALDYLHSQYVFHKDIKPANLKLTPEGNLKLLDFGLAKGSAGLMSQTAFSFLKGGTPEYAAPEQLEEKSASQQSDLYSVGATMFHLLTGKVPPSSSDRALRIAMKKPDLIFLASELNPNVPKDLAEVFHKAMMLNPEERFQTAKEMRKSLEKAWQEYERKQREAEEEQRRKVEKQRRREEERKQREAKEHKRRIEEQKKREEEFWDIFDLFGSPNLKEQEKQGAKQKQKGPEIQKKPEEPEIKTVKDSEATFYLLCSFLYSVGVFIVTYELSTYLSRNFLEYLIRYFWTNISSDTMKDVSFYLKIPCFLISLLFFSTSKNADFGSAPKSWESGTIKGIIGGVICGFFLFSSLFQQTWILFHSILEIILKILTKR